MLLLRADHLWGTMSTLPVYDRKKFLIFIVLKRLSIHNSALITAVIDDFQGQNTGLWIKLLSTSVREQDWVFKCCIWRTQMYIMSGFPFTYFTYFCPVRYQSWVSNETVIWKTGYLYFIMFSEIWRLAARCMGMNHFAVVFQTELELVCPSSKQ